MKRLGAGADTVVDVRTGCDRVLVDDFVFSVNYEQNLLLARRRNGSTTTTHSKTYIRSFICTILLSPPHTYEEYGA